MVVYIAARAELPLVAFRKEAPGFNVTELSDHEMAVGRHFSLRHIRQAGSHTSCGCGFNEGRQYPEVYDDAEAERRDALRSSAELVKYIREHQVEEVYSCWSGDEGEAKVFDREVAPEEFLEDGFFFREREYFRLKRDGRK